MENKLAVQKVKKATLPYFFTGTLALMLSFLLTHAQMAHAARTTGGEVLVHLLEMLSGGLSFGGGIVIGAGILVLVVNLRSEGGPGASQLIGGIFLLVLGVAMMAIGIYYHSLPTDWATGSL